MSIHIERLPVADSLDTPDGERFMQWANFDNDAWEWLLGNPYSADDPNLRWAQRRDSGHKISVDLAAYDDAGRLVGIGNLTADHSRKDAAEIHVAAHSDDHWDSVGDALLDGLFDEARALGRHTLQLWSGHRPVPERDGVSASSGHGWVSRSAQARWLQRHGFSLGIVERHSGVELRESPQAWAELRDGAMKNAGSDYRLEWWTGRTPNHLVEGYALAFSRMDKDAPAGGLSVEVRTRSVEEMWERDQHTIDSGNLFGRAAVVHVPTERVAAFTELQVAADRSQPTATWSTLVVPEHRGRQLGMLVKAHALLCWGEEVPDSPLVHTWNAVENQHMLRVNDALEFQSLDYLGGWELVLE